MVSADDYRDDISAIVDPAVVEEQHQAQRNAAARAIHDATYWHMMRNAGVPVLVVAACVAVRAATDTV